MGVQENELLDKIKAGMEQVTVPESLQPEEIEKKLKPKQPGKSRRAYTYGLAAACCLIVAGVLSVYGVNRSGSTRSTSGATGRNTREEAKQHRKIYSPLRGISPRQRTMEKFIST